ncbi:MAG: inositol monophosphatase [Xanthomonadales bacterium]|nr:inositol monophosphatase [Gammaproteobacteria bacterium]MBT8053738.1 inositol monophosphatase [Gammaproteobacteria bacterium]NND56751.1 inositol monophosphatase [Xanthomonadales bacterium]NNK50953.1 inositol monophosphatase [Xanthomonadales bacterium]
MTHPVLNVAIEAAHAAAKIMRRQMQHVDAIPVERKARHDYVSEVDRACEAEIVREIKRYYPDHGFVCEESGKTGESDYVWIIDPLDGTSNYLHGLPHFAVSIAQQVKGRTEHAVVYDPLRDELFIASRGSGAFLNSKRIRVAARNGLEGAILATAFPFRDRGKMQAYARIFQSVFAKVEDFRRAGTASLDLAWVAAGRMDGYFEMGLKPWDVAAGALIVREAGGVVMDFDGNDAVEDAGTIIAAPYKVMTPLRQLISSKWKNP